MVDSYGNLSVSHQLIGHSIVTVADDKLYCLTVTGIVSHLDQLIA